MRMTKLNAIAIIIGIIFFIIGMAKISKASVTTYACGLGTDEYSFQLTPCSPTIQYNHWQILNYYTTAAEAEAAAAAIISTLETAYPSYTSSGYGSYDGLTLETGFGVNRTIWGGYQANVNNCNMKEMRLFLYIKSSWVDEDQDCISDETACEDECYFVWQGWKNSTGDWLYVKVVTTGGRTLHYGDMQDAIDCINGTISGCEFYENPLIEYELDNADTEICDNMCDIATNLDLEHSSIAGNEQTIDLPESEKGTAGQAQEGGDTDSELLGKIADNTSETANNTDGLEDGLTSIERQLIIANTKLDEMNNKSSIDQPSTNDIERATNLIGATEDLDPEDFEFTEEDVEEDGALSDLLDNLVSNNPVQDYLDNISLTTSDPACSIEDEYEVFGTTIDVEISLCDYEDEIELTGTILYVLAVIIFIYIIFT